MDGTTAMMEAPPLALRDALPVARPRIDEAIAIDDRPGGYQWWYFDATSDDGEWALVVLFFVGSVFSPWYAERLQKGERARPSEHPAVNVALYRRGRSHRWAFNERGDARTVQGRMDPYYRVGASEVRIDARGGYDIAIDEALVRFDRRGALRGHIRFEPVAGPATQKPLVLDSLGEHRWHCVAPRCRVQVDLREPKVSWSGTGYHDINHGDVPLGRSFARWTWARSHGAEGTSVRYDRVLRDGTRRVLSLAMPTHGDSSVHDTFDASPMALGIGGWLLDEPRVLHACDGAVNNVRRVESSPFYARYTGRSRDGAAVVAEHLDLDRFAHPIVQWMLPYRARRDEGISVRP